MEVIGGDRGRGARDPFLYHGKLSGAWPQMSSRRAQADPEDPQDDSYLPHKGLIVYCDCIKILVREILGKV